MNEKKGGLVISLDFEKYWGMRDKRSLDSCRENLTNVDRIVEKLLETFDTYQIRATWAIVGFLFHDSFSALNESKPSQLPTYQNSGLNPYDYLQKYALKPQDDFPLFHLAKEAIQKIHKTKGQEIATHTYSHFYCLEEGVGKESFKADIQMAKRVARGMDIEFQSIVFPRNQYSSEYLNILSEEGIKVYRGNEDSWLYASSKDEKHGIFRRAVRLIDAHLNISGHHAFTWSKDGDMINVPSSRLLRPFSSRAPFLDMLKARRIKKSMLYAARNGQFFHLWWHPHNFGRHMVDNFKQLHLILDYHRQLQEQYGFGTLNMGDFLKRKDG